MKKALGLLAVCLILVLPLSACKDKEETAADPVATTRETPDSSAPSEPPIEEKASEEGALPDENEEVFLIDETDETTFDDGYVPIDELPAAKTDGLAEAVALLMERSTDLDFSSAIELAAPDSGAQGYLSQMSSLDPELLLGSEAYMQIRSFANLLNVDITTQANSEKLIAFIQRLAPYISYSIGTVTSDGTSARAEVSIVTPDIKAAAVVSVINNYLTSIGTDMSSVRSAIELMAPEERTSYMEELAWGVMDYALSGGLDMSKTAAVPLTLTLISSEEQWLVTEII